MHAAILIALAVGGLRLHGDAKCFSIHELQRELDASSFWRDAAAELDIRVENVPKGWQLSVEVQSTEARAERSLVVPTCALALRSIVLIVSLALEDLRAHELAAQESSATATVAAPSPAITERSRSVIRPAPAAETSDRAGFDIDLYLGAAALSRWGLLPGTAPGVALIAGARGDGYQMFARLDYTFSRRQLAAGLEGAGGDFDYLDAHLAACATSTVHLAAVAGCLAGEVGFMRARGFGVENPRAPARPWAGVGVGGGVRLPISSRLAFVLEGEALLAIRRPSFEIGDLGVVHTPAALAGSAVAGLELFL